MTDSPLAMIDKARILLYEARDVQTVKQIHDSAAAAREYAQQANLGKEAINYASEIILRAERRMGEILAVAPKNEGSRAQLQGRDLSGGAVVAPPEARAPKLVDLGISKKQSARAQQIASIPEDKFEAAIEHKKQSGEDITPGGVLRDLVRTQNREDRLENLETISASSRPLASDIGVFPVIYADPPWQYDANTTDPSRVIENQYPTMPLADILALPVAEICTSDAVLFLWATSPLLWKAMAVLSAWGFSYQSSMVWVKDKIGMGYWSRSQHELLLIATTGNPPKPAPADRPSSVLLAPRLDHSAKPVEMYQIIERMFPSLPKIELFARTQRDGWHAWGNQSGS